MRLILLRGKAGTKEPCQGALVVRGFHGLAFKILSCRSCMLKRQWKGQCKTKQCQAGSEHRALKKYGTCTWRLYWTRMFFLIPSVKCKVLPTENYKSSACCFPLPLWFSFLAWASYVYHMQWTLLAGIQWDLWQAALAVKFINQTSGSWHLLWSVFFLFSNLWAYCVLKRIPCEWVSLKF